MTTATTLLLTPCTAAIPDADPPHRIRWSSIRHDACFAAPRCSLTRDGEQRGAGKAGGHMTRRRHLTVRVGLHLEPRQYTAFTTVRDPARVVSFRSSSLATSLVSVPSQVSRSSSLVNVPCLSRSLRASHVSMRTLCSQARSGLMCQQDHRTVGSEHPGPADLVAFCTDSSVMLLARPTHCLTH